MARSKSFQKARQGAEDHSVRINAWHPVATHAQNLMAQLRDVPTASQARVFAPIEKRVAEVRAAVIADAGTQINATPETPEALKGLATYVPKTKAEMLASLSDADYAGLDKQIDARRNAIEDSLAAKEIARIDAAPKRPTGSTCCARRKRARSRRRSRRSASRRSTRRSWRGARSSARP